MDGRAVRGQAPATGVPDADQRADDDADEHARAAGRSRRGRCARGRGRDPSRPRWTASRNNGTATIENAIGHRRDADAQADARRRGAPPAASSGGSVGVLRHRRSSVPVSQCRRPCDASPWCCCSPWRRAATTSRPSDARGPTRSATRPRTPACPTTSRDVLELAARGVDGTFQVTYAGEAGASLVISQAPPDRRIDVVTGDRVGREPGVPRRSAATRCAPPADDPVGAARLRALPRAVWRRPVRSPRRRSRPSPTISSTSSSRHRRCPWRRGRSPRREATVPAWPVDRGTIVRVCRRGRASSSSTRPANASRPSSYTTDVPEGTFDT